MNNFEKDIPKYKKKKNSSKSKSNMKANHKHEYEECLFEIGLGWISRGEYCKICGRINIWFPETAFSETHPGCRTLLTPEEVLEKYKDLRCFSIPDYCTKFVDLKTP